MNQILELTDALIIRAALQTFRNKLEEDGCFARLDHFGEKFDCTAEMVQDVLEKMEGL